MNFDEHIAQDALEQFAMESLPESEIEPLEKHLQGCQACQDRLTHIHQFMAAFCAAARKIAQETPAEEG